MDNAITDGVSTEAKRGISTNALKICATIFMVCDHIPYLSEAWYMQYWSFPIAFMHMAGRLSAPIFFYLIAVGYRRTSDVNRYTLRLLVFALISYAPYVWYTLGWPPNAQNFLDLNAIFTMLLGLLLLRALHELKNLPLRVTCIALCLIVGYWCEYGLYGIAIILICDLTRGSRRGTIIGVGAVMLVFVNEIMNRLLPVESGPFSYARLFSDQMALAYALVHICSFLPLILIARHSMWFSGGAEEKRPGALAKWWFYIFYPAHITALCLLRTAGVTW